MKFRRIITLVYGSWFFKTLHCLQLILTHVEKPSATLQPGLLVPHVDSQVCGVPGGHPPQQRNQSSVGVCRASVGPHELKHASKLVRSGDGILPASPHERGCKDIDLYTKYIIIVFVCIRQFHVSTKSFQRILFWPIAENHFWAFFRRWFKLLKWQKNAKTPCPERFNKRMAALFSLRSISSMEWSFQLSAFAMTPAMPAA